MYFSDDFPQRLGKHDQRNILRETDRMGETTSGARGADSASASIGTFSGAMPESSSGGLNVIRPFHGKKHWQAYENLRARISVKPSLMS